MSKELLKWRKVGEHPISGTMTDIIMLLENNTVVKGITAPLDQFGFKWYYSYGNYHAIDSRSIKAWKQFFHPLDENILIQNI